jgi:cyanophycinase
MYRILTHSLLLVLVLCIVSCSNQSPYPKGELFIIGGGKRPPAMIQKLIEVAEMDEEKYIAILPMSSSEPDTSAYYAGEQFIRQGYNKIVVYNFQKDVPAKPDALDSLKDAGIIYITGGVQTKFMDVVLDTKVEDAIREAYQEGATIAGTSAGAAVMSKKMLTGNEYKHPEYTGDFRTIEADNIELTAGLGLLPNAIIDQHFIRRMRMNRLVSAIIENPDQIGIGIDESTAIIVKDGLCTVTGESQVVVLRNPSGNQETKNGLLGAEEIIMSIFLPGDQFELDQ